MNRWAPKSYVFIFIGLIFGMALTGFGGGDDPKALAQREGLNMVAKNRPEWQETKKPGKINITEVLIKENAFGKRVLFKGEFTPQCDLYGYTALCDGSMRTELAELHSDFRVVFGWDETQQLAAEMNQVCHGSERLIELTHPAGEPYRIKGSFALLKNEKNKLVMNLKLSDIEAEGKSVYSLEYLKKEMGDTKFYLKGSKEAKKLTDLETRVEVHITKVKDWIKTNLKN